MPGAPDKIIINSNTSRGMAAAIQAEFDSLKGLGGEIVAAGWEAETFDLRDELTAACDEHFKADMQYYDFLRGYSKKLAAFIDQKIKDAATTP